MLFWMAIVVFALANSLLAWSATFKNLSEFERPRVINEGWFQLAKAIGVIGWYVVPIMLYSKYGFVGAALGGLGYIISGLVFAMAIKGTIEMAFDADRGCDE